MDWVFCFDMMRSFSWKLFLWIDLFEWNLFCGFEMPSISLIPPNNLGEKPRYRGRSFHGVKPRSSSFSSEKPKKPSRAFSCIEITAPLRREWKTSFLKNYEVLPEVPSHEVSNESELIDVRRRISLYLLLFFCNFIYFNFWKNLMIDSNVIKQNRVSVSKWKYLFYFFPIPGEYQIDNLMKTFVNRP